MDQTKVVDIVFKSSHYEVQTGNAIYRVKIAAGSFGKRSNIDVKWNRDFILQKPNSLNNYIGVKYHIKTDHPEDTIVLHNFKNGYCGMSKIEDDKYCLCYLTTAANLQEHGGIAAMEEKVLYQNPHLKNIFQSSEFLFDKPVSISQVSFDNKEIVHNHIPLTGDACGMITPLSGNGMSMAMHGGKLLSAKIDLYLQQKISLNQMLLEYETQWKTNFAARLRTGRSVQKRFGKTWQTNLFVSFLKHNRWLANKIIKNTHGMPF